MYGTIVLADAYFLVRMNTSPWDDSTDPEKTAALTDATDIVDNLNYVGEKADEDQELEFPRGTDTEVPTKILRAVYEIAKSLLDGIDPELEKDTLGMLSQGFASVRSTYDRDRDAEHILAGVPSFKAWILLRPYLRETRALNLSRV